MSKPKIDRDFTMPRSMDELPFGPSGRAGVLIESNAGWRVQRPVVDGVKCIKCRVCWVYCPEGAIEKDIVIDMDFCKGCGICANECPVKAVRMISERDAANQAGAGAGADPEINARMGAANQVDANAGADSTGALAGAGGADADDLDGKQTGCE